MYDTHPLISTNVCRPKTEAWEWIKVMFKNKENIFRGAKTVRISQCQKLSEGMLFSALNQKKGGCLLVIFTSLLNVVFSSVLSI